MHRAAPLPTREPEPFINPLPSGSGNTLAPVHIPAVPPQLPQQNHPQIHPRKSHSGQQLTQNTW